MTYLDNLRLDGDRMLQQLRQLGEIGRDREGGGRTRLALTDEDRAARDQLVEWMRELDLDVRVDRAGNIFGTLHSSSDDDAQRPLMLGSHIDTVRNAGMLDGCYGVLAALAVVRAFRDAGDLPSRSITVAAFTNEEGTRYHPDMMGSLIYAGGLSVREALDTIGIDGSRFGDELARIGYAGDMEPGAIVPHEYVELHIEQGPILWTEKIQIGVVDRLQGISWQRITVHGSSNHAGTTPIRMRHDAGLAAASIVTFLRELAVSSGTTLTTVGALSFEPGVVNVIPRRAVLTVDMRDPDGARLRSGERQLSEFLDEVAQRDGVEIDLELLAHFEPVTFDAGLASAIEVSAERLGFSHRRMISGAGQDAQMIARIAPAAMIFVPSHGGISHDPDEHTGDEELVAGARVLLDVARRRAVLEGEDRA